jgi:hypothetical protein
MKKIITIIVTILLLLIITTSGCIDSNKGNEKEEIEQGKDEEYKLEGWSEEIKITDGKLDALQPSIAIDSNDNLHIIYVEANRKTDHCDIKYSKISNGKVVENEILASNEGWAGAIWWPQIAIDSKDNVHCCWPIPSYNANVDFDIYYMKLDNNGNILKIDSTPPIELSLGQIAIDSEDNIHLFGGFLVEKYAKLDDEGNIIIDKKTLNFSIPQTGLSSVIVDSKNNLQIIGRSKTDPDSDFLDNSYIKLDNNGNILKNSTRLTFTSTSSGDSKIAIDSKDNIHLVWDDYRDWDSTKKDYEINIYYKKINCNGNVLVNDSRITFLGSKFIYPHIAIDTEDNVHVVASKREDSVNKSETIFYLKFDNNGNELIPMTIISSKYGSGLNIKIDSNNKIHVAWSRNDLWYGGTHNTIYYRTNAFSENITSDDIDNTEKSDDFPVTVELGLFIITIIIAVAAVFVWWRRKKR